MKISVLGAGSVGLGIAASLVKTGLDVTLIARSNSLRALATDGIHVSGVLGEHTIAPGDFTVSDTAGSPDLLIVTTKTYEVAPALQSLLPSLKSKPALLLLQNGWGSADEAKRIMPPGTPIYSASVMTGLERLSPTQVRINAFGAATHVGSLFGDGIEPVQPLFDVSKEALLPFVHEPDIEPSLLTKLIYNTCLNPLGALLRCTYGELLGNEPTLALMERIADEDINVLKTARGYSRFATGESYIRGELIPKWMAKVAAHRSSMLQDIESGRRTEIAYLNGAIAVLGCATKIPTPHNDTIIALIEASENRKS